MVALALPVLVGGLGCDDSRGSTGGTGGATQTGGGSGTGGGVGTGGEAGTHSGTGGVGIGGVGTGGDGTGGVGTGGVGIGSGGVAGDCRLAGAAPLGVASHAVEGANHVVACSPVSYLTVPPSSGNHYPVWPVYKTYDAPVPWGFMVHGLEHGAVEIVYNCPGGCPDEVAITQAWIDALATDPGCPGSQPRVILAPDPTLDVRWAATAWTWTLRACAFDRAAFQQFFDDHYNHAPEINICGGLADYSLIGWCP